MPSTCVRQVGVHSSDRGEFSSHRLQDAELFPPPFAMICVLTWLCNVCHCLLGDRHSFLFIFEYWKLHGTSDMLEHSAHSLRRVFVPRVDNFTSVFLTPFTSAVLSSQNDCQAYPK